MLSLPQNLRFMKHGKGKCLFLSLVIWVFCLSHLHASNFSLIKDHKLVINQTEIKISQAESQPLTETENTVGIEIEISDNVITIRDTANKALLFSIESNTDYQILKLFKKNCLDNLVKSNCLDEFIEKFYTLFDPFRLEYQFYSGNNLILAKLVKESSSGLKSYDVQTGILYLQSSENLTGPAMVYEISSGRKVFSTNIRSNENSLDLSGLRSGNYILVCRNKRFKFVLN